MCDIPLVAPNVAARATLSAQQPLQLRVLVSCYENHQHCSHSFVIMDSNGGCANRPHVKATLAVRHKNDEIPDTGKHHPDYP